MTIEEYKERFISIFKSNIKREGADKLLDWLLKSDFFTTPASTKYHSACEGGLLKHSIFVYEQLLQCVKEEFGESYNEFVTDESIAICGLLHDLCKVDFYKVEYRNQKIDGAWVSVPHYVISEQLPYGHGEKSVYIISGFMRLTRDEAMAINWHMGGFDNRVQGGSYSIGEAYDKHFLALLTHIADMKATYLCENHKYNEYKNEKLLELNSDTKSK